MEGERWLTEFELDWLPGYEGSRPVRAGNAASEQFQLDVYGELMDALYQARAHDFTRPDRLGCAAHPARLPRVALAGTGRGDRGDPGTASALHPLYGDGLGRRGPRSQGGQDFGLDGPVQRWKRLRQEIFDEVCERGYDRERGTFTQYYGSTTVDASLLLASVGFLPATDEPITGTVAAIERELFQDGFVQRYQMSSGTAQLDGLPPGEGASYPAASGWRTTTSCRVGPPRGTPCSTGCWTCVTISACSPRSTIPRPGG